jgi:hypothetical protein
MHEHTHISDLYHTNNHLFVRFCTNRGRQAAGRPRASTQAPGAAAASGGRGVDTSVVCRLCSDPLDRGDGWSVGKSKVKRRG